MSTGSISFEHDLEYVLTDSDWDLIFSQTKYAPNKGNKKGVHVVNAFKVLKQAKGAFVPAKEIFGDESGHPHIEPIDINDRLRINGLPYRLFSKKPGPRYFFRKSYRLVKIKVEYENVVSLNNLELVERLIQRSSAYKKGPELDALRQEVLERLDMLNFLMEAK